jgi:Ion channel
MDKTPSRQTRLADNYALLFVALLVTLVLIAVAGDDSWGRALVLLTIATSTWLALRASRVERVLLRVAVAVIPIVTAAALLLLIFGSDWTGNLVTGVLMLLLVVVSPLAITRRFIKHPEVTLNTFFAAVSLYLLVAMFFALLYSTISLVSGEPFFVQTATDKIVDYLYFSFTTITTVGYGDFTAAGGLGKMMAMIEAVLGQLYLITVVALVVQNLSQARQQRRAVHAGEPPEGGTPSHERGTAPHERGEDA